MLVFFSRLIGEVLSDHLDLHHDSWIEVLSEMVQILKNHVKSYFRLDDNNSAHVEGLDFGLSRGYSKTRSSLHLNIYKPHFKDINVEDPAAVADASAKARATIPTHLCREQWSLI
ncbi:uncharacterized protein LOC133872901 [Alnus glutinosa]|uniref:uncharacterized protein LOC133872901 n=1 Tax=Alnus glutinosa TaxID=3517 RepID=UPI002D770431|nr:uncharacterized protein LOC133872901 [Alnus glutinosa]